MVPATAFRLTVKLPRRHQTAIRGRAVSCSHATTALSLFPSLRGNWETLRPRNLCVPHAGQAKRQARSPKGDVPSPEAFGAESRPRQTRDRQPATHRLSSKSALHVGSLGRLLGVRKPRGPARGPFQPGEVEPSAQVSRAGSWSHFVTHSDALALLRLSSASSSPRRAGVAPWLIESHTGRSC